MRHKGTQTIETKRLILRPLTKADAPAMYQNWASSPAVTRYLRWQPHTSLFETEQLLAAWEPLYQNPDYYQWAMEEKATGIVFGSISLYDSRTAETPEPALWQTSGLDFSAGLWEPGYCIGEHWWGKGYTTEALEAVVSFWFDDVEGSWLSCCHAAQNPASGRVMEHAGFVFDHPAIYHKFDGTPVNCKAYCLTRARYQALRGSNG